MTHAPPNHDTRPVSDDFTWHIVDTELRNKRSNRHEFKERFDAAQWHITLTQVVTVGFLLYRVNRHSISASVAILAELEVSASTISVVTKLLRGWSGLLNWICVMDRNTFVWNYGFEFANESTVASRTAIAIRIQRHYSLETSGDDNDFDENAKHDTGWVRKVKLLLNTYRFQVIGLDMRLGALFILQKS